MSVGFRTLVRVFLLVGGAAYAAFGAVSGSAVQVGFGVLAALVGGLRLWWERRDTSEP